MTDKTTFDGDSVEVTRVTKHTAHGEGHELTWVLNYENCTREQLLELASRSMVINLQRQFRSEKGTDDKWNNRTFDVAEVLAESKKRMPVDPRVAALKLLGTMNEDEREAFLAEL